MQVAASPFSSSQTHYHSYYQFQPAGPHDHELKRQYLSLLPPKQIIEICLTFDAYVPPYAKTTIWPLDLNAAIAALQKTPTSSSLNESLRNAVDDNSQPNGQETRPSESESLQTGGPPPADPQFPFGYGHSHLAYPHTPYYPSGYNYPYPYPPPVQNGSQTPSAPVSAFPPSPYGQHPQPEASGNDDLPSYEEMIVEALSECTDPEGWVPKDLFTWMAARYPLQSNFRPSASQALQKAYKRGRFEKGANGKYRLSTSWEGGNTSRRTTRRPQTQGHTSSGSVNRAPIPPFTNTPLVHHHQSPHSVPAGQMPYPVPYGYPAYFPQPVAPLSGAGPPSPSEKPNSNTTGDSAAAYEAAQSILKAINFGELLKLPPEEEQKNEGQAQTHDGVEQLLTHVQAVLASRHSQEGGTLHDPVAEATPFGLASSSDQVPESKRAQLQAQLALLSAQLAELAQIGESQIAADQALTVSVSAPPMHILAPDEPQTQISKDVSTSTVRPESTALESVSSGKQAVHPSSAAQNPESDEDDMEAVI